MNRSKRTRRGPSRTAAISAALCLALAVAVGVPRFLSWRGAEEEIRQYEEALRAQAVEYEAGTPFTLHGDADAPDEDLASEWDWNGDLQFEYSNARAFRTLEEAGFAPEEIDDEPRDGASGYVCVDLALTNVDAHCRPETVDYLGGEGIHAGLFSLSGDNGDSSMCDVIAISGPAANVPNIESSDPNKARGYIWAEPGSTSHYRMAFACEDGPVPTHPRLLLDIDGDIFGLITVDLGELDEMPDA